MRVSLDANVLISAYTTRGLSSDVYRHVLAEHDVVLSELVLAEFERVLIAKFGIPVRHGRAFVDELRIHEIQETGTLDESLEIIRDPDDQLVVAAAIEGNCELLVTGDRDILDVRDRLARIRAVTPREYWESIRG